MEVDFKHDLLMHILSQIDGIYTHPTDLSNMAYMRGVTCLLKLSAFHQATIDKPIHNFIRAHVYSQNGKKRNPWFIDGHDKFGNPHVYVQMAQVTIGSHHVCVRRDPDVTIYEQLEPEWVMDIADPECVTKAVNAIRSIIDAHPRDTEAYLE